MGNRRLMKHTYMIEIASNAQQSDYLNEIAQSCNIPRANIKQRHAVNSDVGSFISFTVTKDNDTAVMEAIAAMQNVLGIYPVYARKKIKPKKTLLEFDALDLSNISSIMSHDLTGVDQVHHKLKNFGKGVKVRMILNGILINYLSRFRYVFR